MNDEFYFTLIIVFCIATVLVLKPNWIAKQYEERLRKVLRFLKAPRSVNTGVRLVFIRAFGVVWMIVGGMLVWLAATGKFPEQ